MISVDDFDKSALPAHARTPGTDEFRQEVTKFFQAEFASFGGRARINVSDKTIEVRWHTDPKQPLPMEVVKAKLDSRQFPEAIGLLEKLRRYQPDDIAVLCNLGMALSDAGRLEEAERILRRAMKVDPEHVSTLVALGVALARRQRHGEAVPILKEAVALEPTNPWAHRNLGGCLQVMGQMDEAEKSLRRAVELNPTDPQALFGLGQILWLKNELEEADVLFIKVIDLDDQSESAEYARQARTKMAQSSFRSTAPGIERPDAVMYCLSAIQKFEKMELDEVRQIGFEIAMLGRKGLQTNDPAEQYRLKSLPGRFSGLHLICLMFVSFKKVAPDYDVGFDLSKEFDLASKMHQKGQKS